MADQILTADRAQELFHYDPISGELTRKATSKLVGSKTSNGYLAASVDGKTYLVHRLAWLIVHGSFPSEDTDHINRDKSDNRLENLRDVPRKLNIENRDTTRANTSGVPGVYWEPENQKWRAKIRHNYKQIHLGRFATKAEAIRARQAAEQMYFAPQPS